MKQTPNATSRFEFIIMMSLLVAVDALSIDAILPALSNMSNEFGVNQGNDRQYIVTSIFIGFAFGVMIFGVASDSFGRKRPIYVGFGIFFIGTLVVIFASSFNMLLVGRILQGFGAAGPQVIPTAITRDLYKGRGMAEVMSLIMMVFMLGPTIAPLLGQTILLFSNWQGIFVMLGIYALFALAWFAIRLPETLLLQQRAPFSFKQVFSSVKVVLANKRAVMFTLAEGFTFGAVLAYLSTAQQVFQDHFQLGERFPLYFGALALVMMLASYVNSRLVEKLGMHWLVVRASLLLFIASCVYLLIILLSNTPVPFWSFMLFASIAYFCFGILFGNMHSLAMEEVGHVAGVAASVIGSLSTLIATLIAAFIGSFYNDSITPIVLGFGILMLPIILITLHDSKSTIAKS
jgi:DHA1 family bicyclomycin/chloramphenicol resistance-like MFS transporter